MHMLEWLCHQSIHGYKCDIPSSYTQNVKMYLIIVTSDLSNQVLMFTFGKQALKSFMFWIDFTWPDRVLILILPLNVQTCSICLSLSNDRPTENNFALWVVRSSLIKSLTGLPMFTALRCFLFLRTRSWSVFLLHLMMIRQGWSFGEFLGLGRRWLMDNGNVSIQY